MIATNTTGKANYCATNASITYCDGVYDEVMIYGPMVAIILPPAEQSPEPKRPRAERTAHRYIDHLWPVERITITTEELDRGCSEPPCVEQKASTYG